MRDILRNRPRQLEMVQRLWAEALAQAGITIDPTQSAPKIWFERSSNTQRHVRVTVDHCWPAGPEKGASNCVLFDVGWEELRSEERMRFVIDMAIKMRSKPLDTPSD